MELRNNRWYDKNGNSWNAEFESEESARAKSESLIDCQGCRDCQDCRGCHDCYGCQNSSYCVGCQNLRYCRGCRGCSDCQYCLNCRYCRGWTANPRRIVSPEMGSRSDQTTIYFDNERTEVVCGAFAGTLEEFKEAVATTHGSNEHGIAYNKWIESVERYLEAIKEGE